MDAFDSSLGSDGSVSTCDDAPVLIDLWHPDCTACRDVQDRLATFKHRMPPTVSVGRLNVTEIPDLAEELGIDRVPTLLVCREGSVEACLRGTEEILPFIDQVEDTFCS